MLTCQTKVKFSFGEYLHHGVILKFEELWALALHFLPEGMIRQCTEILIYLYFFSSLEQAQRRKRFFSFLHQIREFSPKMVGEAQTKTSPLGMLNHMIPSPPSSLCPKPFVSRNQKTIPPSCAISLQPLNTNSAGFDSGAFAIHASAGNDIHCTVAPLASSDCQTSILRRILLSDTFKWEHVHILESMKHNTLLLPD